MNCIQACPWGKKNGHKQSSFRFESNKYSTFFFAILGYMNSDEKVSDHDRSSFSSGLVGFQIHPFTCNCCQERRRDTSLTVKTPHLRCFAIWNQGMSNPFAKINVTSSGFCKLLTCSTIQHFLRFSFQHAVFMDWLGSCTETTWLGLGETPSFGLTYPLCSPQTRLENVF